MNNIQNITAIYLGMLRKLLYFAASAAAIVSAGLIIVFPIWYFAVNYPSGYSVSLVVLAVLFFLYSFSLKIRKKKISAKILTFLLLKFLYFLVLIFGAAAVVVLYMNSLIFQGSVLMTALYIISGILIYIKRKQEK